MLSLWSQVDNKSHNLALQEYKGDMSHNFVPSLLDSTLNEDWYMHSVIMQCMVRLHICILYYSYLMYYVYGSAHAIPTYI